MTELIDLCSKLFDEETNKVENIKLEYSYTYKILIIFTNNYLYVIDNSKNIPNQIAKIKINFQIKYTSIHPKTQNQLLIITNNDIIYLIPDLKSFSKLDQIKQLNIKLKNIISIKFSYFDNYFGILFDGNKFNLYYINSESKEEIMLSEELDTNYIDFNFCPQFSLGFDMFMIFFMTKIGELKMYGPFFPEQFDIKKEFFFNMNNFLIYKLNTMQNNNSDYQKYVISLAIIDDLKKSITNELKDDYQIKISEKIKKVNATFKKREININNNFISNSNSDIFNINYKQIYILEKRPLTILRISDNNNMDIIMISDEIFPELANTGNIIFDNNIKINNYLIEFIQLNKEKKVYKDFIKIIQYENEKIFIKTNDSLYLIKIPYLNELKKAVEDNIMFIPNKMKKTSITKILKWDNNRNKVININDILIIPELSKLYVFSLFKEKIIVNEYGNETFKEIKKIIVKDYNYKDVYTVANIVKFKDILKKEKKENIGIDINIKLNENNSTKNEIKNIKININENLLEDKNNNNFQFEQKLNKDMKDLYKIYNNLLGNNEQIYITKINIMKNIYNNLSNSKIQENINETNKRIIGLKALKEKIIKNNELITKKMDSIKEKINKYELTDPETENYLKMLKKYQKELRDKLNELERRINFCDAYIGENYAYKDLFPKNDLDFNLIEKENQKNYMKFEEEINNKSKELYIKIQK